MSYYFLKRWVKLTTNVTDRSQGTCFFTLAKMQMLQDEGFSCYTVTYLAVTWAKLCFHSKEKDWRILLCFFKTTKLRQLRQCSDLKSKDQPEKIMVTNQNDERGVLHYTGKNSFKVNGEHPLCAQSMRLHLIFIFTLCKPQIQWPISAIVRERYRNLEVCLLNS